MSYSYTKMYLLKKLFLNLENACSFQEKQFLFFLKGNPLNWKSNPLLENFHQTCFKYGHK